MIVFCLIQIPVPFRYTIKVMTAGTDDKLLSQKMYFGDGGVYTAIIQPDPKKNDQVEILIYRVISSGIRNLKIFTFN